jgi:hypothetical protein
LGDKPKYRCACISSYVYIYIYMYVYMCAALYICILYVFLLMYVHIYMYVYIYVYIYVCICISSYVCWPPASGADGCTGADRRQHLAQTASIWRRRLPPRKSGGSVLTLFHSIRIPRRSHFYITCVSLRFHSDFKPLRHVDCTSSNFVSISLRCSLPGSGAGWLSKMMPAL